MSRIGKLPIAIEGKVQVTLKDGEIVVKGPKGQMIQRLHHLIKVVVEKDCVRVERLADDKKSRAFHGLYQRLIANMVKGVTEGFKKELEIVGVGYRAQMQGKSLQMQLGYSHPILFDPPEGIELAAPSPTQIVVSGIDKELVGETSAKIRRFRPPEPYKGKGIRYAGEYVRRKVGKAGAK